MSKKANYIKEQEQDFARLMAIFENIASCIFEYSPLPTLLRNGWIERLLFNEGQGVYFFGDTNPKDKLHGFYFLRLAQGGKLNIYGDLTTYNIINPISRNIVRDIDTAVLFRNNELRLPTRVLIEPLVRELVDIRAAIRVNLNASAKTPVIFRCNSSEELTALNMFEQICGNKPLIIKTKSGIAPEKFQDSNPVTPYLGKELGERYTFVKNEILNLIGVITNPVVKAERVNQVESASNRGEIIDILDEKLLYRTAGVNEVNKLFKKELQAEGLYPFTVKVNNNFTQSLLTGVDNILMGENGNEQ